MIVGETGHNPVMRVQVLELCSRMSGTLAMDLTLGAGGHSEAILRSTGKDVSLLAIDRDLEILNETSGRLEPVWGDRFHAVHGSFGQIRQILADHTGGALPSFILADLGVSSMQLDRPERGFSFRFQGNLDMRMDSTQDLDAGGLLDSIGVPELAVILREFGEIGPAQRLAKEIKKQRGNRQLETTSQLADLCRKHLGGGGRIHPATRVFQAIRMAVNRETEELTSLIRALPAVCGPGCVAAIISFHSVEDRIVKNGFKDLTRDGGFELLTQKPLTPDRTETAENPRARSAKLRAIRRCG